jgi:hypothetical protein
MIAHKRQALKGQNQQRRAFGALLFAQNCAGQPIKIKISRKNSYLWQVVTKKCFVL